jgi:hypothetical protein
VIERVGCSVDGRDEPCWLAMLPNRMTTAVHDGALDLREAFEEPGKLIHSRDTRMMTGRSWCSRRHRATHQLDVVSGERRGRLAVSR